MQNVLKCYRVKSVKMINFNYKRLTMCSPCGYWSRTHLKNTLNY